MDRNLQSQSGETFFAEVKSSLVMDRSTCSQVEHILQDILEKLEKAEAETEPSNENGQEVTILDLELDPPGQGSILFEVESGVMGELLDQLHHLVPPTLDPGSKITVCAKYKWTNDASTYTVEYETKECASWITAQTRDMSTSFGVELSTKSTITELNKVIDESTGTETLTLEFGTMTDAETSSSSVVTMTETETEKWRNAFLGDSSTSPKMKFQFQSMKKSSVREEGQEGGGEVQDKENRGLMESVRKAPTLRLGLSRRVTKPLHQISKMDGDGNGMEN